MARVRYSVRFRRRLVLVDASDGASGSAFALPPLQLIVVTPVGLAAGALAGLRPARKASRLDVLRALATE